MIKYERWMDEWQSKSCYPSAVPVRPAMTSLQIGLYIYIKWWTSHFSNRNVVGSWHSSLNHNQDKSGNKTWTICKLLQKMSLFLHKESYSQSNSNIYPTEAYSQDKLRLIIMAYHHMRRSELLFGRAQPGSTAQQVDRDASPWQHR